MSTNLEKDLAQELAKNVKRKKPKNKQELLVSVGYAELTAKKNAGAVISQKGVQDELKILGFTEDKAKQVVGKIMNNEAEESNTRLKAADMTFKVHGTYAPEKSLEVKVNINPLDPKALALAEEYEKKLRDNL